RVGRFHLRDFVLAALIGAEIEAAQLVVEMSGEFDLYLGWTGRELIGNREGCRLIFLVCGYLRGLCLPAGADRDFVEIDLQRVERNRVARFAELEVDRLVALITIRREVDVYRECIVIGRRAARQALGESWTAGKQTGCKHKQVVLHISLSRMEDV